MNKGQIVALGRHGKLERKHLISEVINQYTDPAEDVLHLGSSYKAVAKMLWGEEAWNSVSGV